MTTTQKPSPRAVIAAALARPIPCTECGSINPCRCLQSRPKTEAYAELVEAALVAYGYLPEPDASEFDPEAGARWLADHSGFPRYSAEGGWCRLLESEIDVEVAATKALARLGGEDVATARTIKAALLSWHSARQV